MEPPIQFVSCDYSLDKPVDFYADPEDSSSVESTTTIHWKKSKTADERSMESFNERFRTFLECHLQSSSSSKGSNQSNSTSNSPSLLLNAARNEIDVLLDLLTNVLDLGNIQLVDSSSTSTTTSTNEESSSISTSSSAGITQIYHQLRWNSRIRQREFRNLHLELEKFHLEAASSLKVRQNSFGKLFQLKKGTQKWRFHAKILQNTPQLYLDYGYSAMGGFYEGLALVMMTKQTKSLGNEGEFEFAFPVVHRQKLKKLKLSVGFSSSNGEGKACSFQSQQCEFQYPSLSNDEDDFVEKSLQLQMLSLLSMEAFQMFKCSAKELRIDAFASESEQFTICLPSSTECLTTLSIGLQEQHQEHHPTFSRLELFALKVVLQIFLHQKDKKE